ncbi:hypothetical protein PLESTM_001164500 [Pleodorina starrii]|nr:hypothetical protein PLESTM_001164500 [Pleodorina starrii]
MASFNSWPPAASLPAKAYSVQRRLPLCLIVPLSAWPRALLRFYPFLQVMTVVFPADWAPFKAHWAHYTREFIRTAAAVPPILPEAGRGSLSEAQARNAHRLWSVLTRCYFHGLPRPAGDPQDPALGAWRKAAHWLHRLVGKAGWHKDGPVFKALAAWVQSMRKRLKRAFPTIIAAPAAAAAAAGGPAGGGATPTGCVRRTLRARGELRAADASAFIPIYPRHVSGGFSDNRIKLSLHGIRRRPIIRGACGVPKDCKPDGENCALAYGVPADVVLSFLEADGEALEQLSKEECKKVLREFAATVLKSDKAELNPDHAALNYPRYLAACVEGWDRVVEVVPLWVAAAATFGGGGAGAAPGQPGPAQMALPIFDFEQCLQQLLGMERLQQPLQLPQVRQPAARADDPSQDSTQREAAVPSPTGASASAGPTAASAAAGAGADVAPVHGAPAPGGAGAGGGAAVAAGPSESGAASPAATGAQPRNRKQQATQGPRGRGGQLKRLRTAQEEPLAQRLPEQQQQQQQPRSLALRLLPGVTAQGACGAVAPGAAVDIGVAAGGGMSGVQGWLGPSASPAVANPPAASPLATGGAFKAAPFSYSYSSGVSPASTASAVLQILRHLQLPLEQQQMLQQLLVLSATGDSTAGGFAAGIATSNTVNGSSTGPPPEATASLPQLLECWMLQAQQQMLQAQQQMLQAQQQMLQAQHMQQQAQQQMLQAQQQMQQAHQQMQQAPHMQQQAQQQMLQAHQQMQQAHQQMQQAPHMQQQAHQQMLQAHQQMQQAQQQMQQAHQQMQQAQDMQQQAQQQMQQAHQQMQQAHQQMLQAQQIQQQAQQMQLQDNPAGPIAAAGYDSVTAFGFRIDGCTCPASAAQSQLIPQHQQVPQCQQQMHMQPTQPQQPQAPSPGSSASAGSFTFYNSPSTLHGSISGPAPMTTPPQFQLQAQQQPLQQQLQAQQLLESASSSTAPQSAVPPTVGSPPLEHAPPEAALGAGLQHPLHQLPPLQLPQQDDAGGFFPGTSGGDDFGGGGLTDDDDLPRLLSEQLSEDFPDFPFDAEPWS